MKGSPKQTSAGCFALAGCGKFLLDFLNSHRIHLVSTPLGHNIEKDPPEKHPLGALL